MICVKGERNQPLRGVFSAEMGLFPDSGVARGTTRAFYAFPSICFLIRLTAVASSPTGRSHLLQRFAPFPKGDSFQSPGVVAHAAIPGQISQIIPYPTRVVCVCEPPRHSRFPIHRGKHVCQSLLATSSHSPPPYCRFLAPSGLGRHSVGAVCLYPPFLVLPLISAGKVCRHRSRGILRSTPGYILASLWDGSRPVPNSGKIWQADIPVRFPGLPRDCQSGGGTGLPPVCDERTHPPVPRAPSAAHQRRGGHPGLVGGARLRERCAEGSGWLSESEERRLEAASTGRGSREDAEEENGGSVGQ